MIKKNILKIFTYALFLLVSIFLIFVQDKVLAAGMLFVLLLLAATVLSVKKFHGEDKKLLYLILIVFVIRVVVVFFAHYSNLPMFKGGGDFIIYDQQGHQIANMLSQNFSLENFDMNYYIKNGIQIGHYYPVIVGFIYKIVAPDILVGQLFNAWLAVISAIIIYFLVSELGGSKKSSFWTAFLSTLYVSYLYYGSLLLKDGLVVAMCLLGLLLAVKLLKNFNWRVWLAFYVSVIGIANLRFYVGYALLLSFILCWFLFSKIMLKKKITFGVIFVLLFGLIPQLFGFGYMGSNTIRQYLNPTTINFFRKEAYNPITQPLAIQKPQTTQQSLVIQKPQTAQVDNTQNNFERASDDTPPGLRSSISMGLDFHNFFQFLWTIIKSFVFVILGPFPWQIKSIKQSYILFETIPWIFLIYFMVKGAVKSFKKDKAVFPLISFSILVFGVLSLYLGNFGIVTRIRMPAFLSLICFAPLGLEGSIISSLYEKLNIPSFYRIGGFLKFLAVTIFKIKNWFEFVLYYKNIRKGKLKCFFRNGAVVKTDDDMGPGIIGEVFIRKDYGEVKSNSTIIDIGAHIGVYSIFAAEKNGNTVYAFEPMPENYELLLGNIKGNKLRGEITPFNLAVTAQAGTRNLYVQDSSTNSLYPLSDRNDNEHVAVKCIAMKDIFEHNNIKRCDILKMDCEGAEFEILYNLEDEYLKRIKNIRMEYHNIGSNDDYNGTSLCVYLERKGFVIEKFKSFLNFGMLWAINKNI